MPLKVAIVVAVFSCLAFVRVEAQAKAHPMQGWIGILDPTGNCSYAVPLSWRIDDARERREASGMAFAPDGYASVSQQWVPISDWDVHILRLRVALRPTVVLESTVSRFWAEYRGEHSALTHYVAVPSGGGACTTIIDISDRASPELKSLAPEIVANVAGLR